MNDAGLNGKIQSMLVRHYLKTVPTAAALATALLSLAAAPAVSAATITQTGGTTETNWNNAPIWNGAAAAAGNDYVTQTGLNAANSSSLGAANDLTGRVRDTGSTFSGDSLRIVASTELLIKQEGGQASTGNVILDGGMVRYAGNNANISASLAGTLNIASASVIGVVRASGNATLTVASTLTGSADLRLAGGQNTGCTLVFTGDLSGYTGTFNVGGGNNLLTVRFTQNYNLPEVDLRMADFSSVDRLDLSHGLTFKSFTFGGASLAPGTYSPGDLNLTFGSGSQFLDNGGSLTVLEALGDPLPAVLSKVFIVGDSTVAVWPTSGVTRGWGQEIDHYFSKHVRIVDNALSGRSTKTFITEGWWASTVSALAAGDYVLIQFGHNDSHDPANIESTDAGGDYKTYLQQYIDETLAKGAIPVLVTPMHRRNFDAEGNLLSYFVASNGWVMDLAPYAAAMKEAAVANDVPCIDLFASSGTYMQMLGNEACKTLMVPNDPTHWNELGAFAMASLVSQGLSEVLPSPANPPDSGELTQYLRRNVVGMHRADLAAGDYPRPVFTAEAEGYNLRLDWFLQSSGAIIQYCDDLDSWSNDFSGAEGSVVVSPDGPRAFFRVMTP